MCQTDIGCVPTERHSIALTNSVPIHRAAYRSSRMHQHENDKEADALLQVGFVRPSLSPYAAPAILSEKKGEGKAHMCIDYRKENGVTV